MEIKKFNTNNFSKLCTINLIMKGFDHKYNVIKCILKLMEYHPTRLGIELNEEYSGVLKYFVDKRLIFTNYFPKILENIFNRNKKMLENNLNSKLLFITYHVLNYKSYQDTNIIELSQNYKNHNVSWLDIEQTVNPKPIEIYKSYDWIIFGPEYSLSNLKIIYNRYFSFMESLEQFQDLFSKLTEKYGLIVLDNKNLSNKITDKIFSLNSDTVLKYSKKDIKKNLI